MGEKRSIAPRESSYELNTKRPRKGLQSLGRTVSPPTFQRRAAQKDHKSAAAAIEAGEKHVLDHLSFYSSHLSKFTKPIIPGEPRLIHERWVALYRRNTDTAQGSHFVIHQHDHPVAGTHYDLRLQCNPTSSISFAIMYGLPGDPNSRRLNRNATETRVHCLWNHLIETASHSTGSMLIWDTGEYQVLPNDGLEKGGDITDDELEDGSAMKYDTEQQKLRQAFNNRKIRLRLHGMRLPSGYTLSLRLTSENYRSEQPAKPSRRRRRFAPTVIEEQHSGSENDHDCATSGREHGVVVASDDEDELIRVNNAYTGATNDIGSVHQRKWYLSIDRKASGFLKTVTRSSSGFTDTWWHRTTEDRIASGDMEKATGFDKFVVGGCDTEHSVITGRTAAEILKDEGVIGFVSRGLWRPVTE